MQIEVLKVGYLQTNCYILTINNECIIIDPGDCGERILNKVGDKDILGILITHSHFDHVGALSYFKDIKVYNYHNLNMGLNEIGPFKFETIYTPGHMNDLVTYYFIEEKIMFTGDFIFKDSIGRTDMEFGDISSMLESINKIKKYDMDITIYPGHGDKTNLGYEILNNIYFK